MMRPTRGRKRFQGSGLEASGITNLSNPNEEADGRAMRRRYAFYGAICLVFLALIIALSARGGKGDDEVLRSDTSTASVNMNHFEELSHAFVTPIDSQVNMYKHKQSGMEILTIAPKDISQDATFGVNFRTLPENNKGAAHVLEHAVLCGSKNYPVKDPFNQLQRGSLQTYMDTWTSKDRTSFVMSSRNKVDFRNNIKVLLDAVFHPLVLEEDQQWIFRQEGWRLELENNQILYIQGNAFNEAKAAQMHPEQSMYNYLYRTLFPDHVYAKNSRGESRNIVSLTWEELVEFHDRYYHPSNGQAYCYGPQQYINECLNNLDDVLSEFEADDKIREETKISWENHQKVQSGLDKIPYASYEDINDFRLAETWVVNDQPMDLRTEVGWFLVQELLIGSPVAAMTKTIVDLDLGDDVIGGLEHTLQQWTLTLGVSGIPNSQKVTFARNAIRDKLENIVENGFRDDAMQAAMNRVDFKFRQMIGNGVPLGVATFHQVLAKWNYDEDPKLPLFYSNAFAELKEEINTQGQDFILTLISKRLLDNHHKVTVELFPSTQVAENHAKEEQLWLDSLDDWLSKEEGLQILSETTELHRKQEGNDSEEDLAKVPRLLIGDLNRTANEIPTKEVHDIFDSGITMLEHELDYTGGLTFVDFAIDIQNIKFTDVVLLPLFCRMLVESGNTELSDVHFRRQVDSETGGIWAHPVIEEVLETNSEGSYIVPDGKHMVTKIVVRASCIAETGCLGMFTLIKKILFDSDVTNKDKAKELLEKMIDDMEDDIQTNGHVYTSLRLMSRFSLPGFVNEQWKGVTQLFALRKELLNLNAGGEHWEALKNRLVLMKDAMVKGNRNGMLMSVTGDHQSIKDVSGAIQLFVRDILPPAAQSTKFPDPAEAEHKWVADGTHYMNQEVNAESHNEAFIVPTRVSHVGQGGIVYDVGDEIKGSDMVVAQYLGGYFLYEKLRFNLGAQEAWTLLDIDSGAMIYQSDRDPNIRDTLEVYEDGASWLFEQLNAGNGELPVEAKASIIGAIGELDGTQFQPSAIGYVSMVQYLKQDTKESRQKWREQVIDATVNDFAAVANLLGGWGESRVVVVTSENKYNKAVNGGFEMASCNYDGISCADGA